MSNYPQSYAQGLGVVFTTLKYQSFRAYFSHEALPLETLAQASVELSAVVNWLPRAWGYGYTCESLSFLNRIGAMKPEIHPAYTEVAVTCSCGNSFETRSTAGGSDMHLDVCSACHPFYTGKQKIVDTAGRVDKFRRKYGMS